MTIQKDVALAPNITAGDFTKTEVVWHWWDLPERRPTFAGTVDWLMRSSTQASAHYVTESGRWTQMAREKDAAWHAGSFVVNQRSIGIEVNPRLSDGDYATASALLADIWSRHGRLKNSRHKDYSTTTCPGTLDVGRIVRGAEQLTAGRPVSAAPSPIAVPSSAVHRVRSGETLGAIAAANGTSIGSLQYLNGIQNADRISAGQRLYVRYVLGKGQTLSQLAESWSRSRLNTGRTTAAELARRSGISNPNRVQVGAHIRLP